MLVAEGVGIANGVADTLAKLSREELEELLQARGDSSPLTENAVG
jgi:hypothetical protein